MKKFLVILLAVSSFLSAEKLTILFREPINAQDMQKVRQAIERSRKGDFERIGIVVKRTSVVIQGSRNPLHTIALSLPLELQRMHELHSKLANVVQLDITVLSDKEAEKLVWDIKDCTGEIWKIFRGTRMYTAIESIQFDPSDVYDSHGNFRAEIVGYFYSLPITQEERSKTYELIDKMGTEPWYKLLWNKGQMEKIGEDVDNVHPLRFSGVIFADSHLKECMKEVRSFDLKWKRFLDGFANKMSLNFARRNVLPYLPGYCVETGADYQTLLKLCEAQNWKGLLDYMIDR